MKYLAIAAVLGLGFYSPSMAANFHSEKVEAIHGCPEGMVMKEGKRDAPSAVTTSTSSTNEGNK